MLLCATNLAASCRVPIPKKRTFGSSISNERVFPTPEDEERFAPQEAGSLQCWSAPKVALSP